MKKVIATPDAPKAVGPYSQAIEVNGTVYNVTVRDKFGSKSILLDVGNYTTNTVFFDKLVQSQM